MRANDQGIGTPWRRHSRWGRQHLRVVCDRWFGLVRFPGHWRNETVTAAHYRLQVLRLLGIVLESLPDFPDGRIDALFGVLEDAGAPQPLHNPLARYQVSVGLNHEHQQIEGKVLQLHGRAAAAQFVTSTIQFEVQEPIARQIHCFQSFRRS